MFTGIIEEICTVKSVSFSAQTGSMKLSIDLHKIAETSKKGDSIAVNGICLTISDINASIANFDISSETVTKTTLKGLQPGKMVNIERALLADGRFAGHFVTGHIDGTAKITKIEKKDKFAIMTFSADKSLLENIIPKGSIAVDGISLTIAELNDKTFTVALIPETLNSTTLGSAKTGDSVNIENDLLVKTIKKQLDNLLPKQGLTAEKLKSLGF